MNIFFGKELGLLVLAVLVLMLNHFLRRNAVSIRYLSEVQVFQRLIFYFPLMVILIFIFLNIFNPHFYRAIVVYEGGVEDVQALNYFLAAIVAGFITRDLFKSRRRGAAWFYAVFSLGLAFVCLEEISWGQRVLGLESSEFFLTNNTQKEITVHNLEPFQNLVNYAYIGIGCLGIFAGDLFSKTSLKKASVLKDLLFPRKDLFYYFLPIIISNLLLIYLLARGHRFDASWQEIPELILSFGFLVFVLRRSVLSQKLLKL